MGVVTRDFTATVEYDGEDFTLMLKWSTDRGSYMRPSREEFSLPLEDSELPPEITRDLKLQYQAIYGDANPRTDEDPDITPTSRIL